MGTPQRESSVGKARLTDYNVFFDMLFRRLMSLAERVRLPEAPELGRLEAWALSRLTLAWKETSELHGVPGIVRV